MGALGTNAGGKEIFGQGVQQEASWSEQGKSKIETWQS